MPNLEIPEAFEDLFTPARYKAFHGGRGSAKSHSFAAALLIQAGSAPLRVLCAREVQISIKDSVKQLLDDKIEALGMSGLFESTQHEIRGRNGSLFVFAGLGKLTTDQIKSMEGIDRAWVEEAQTISARSLEILIPTIRRPGSELWFSWNPRHASDPVDQRFRGLVTPDDAVIRRVNYTDNPFFPDVLEKERAFDERSKRDRYAHIWLGEYEPTAVGAIWDRVTLHNGRRHDLPSMSRIVVAVDPAVSNEANSDEHGIVVTGVGADQRGYVLDDVSRHGSPTDCCKAAVAAFDRWDADAVVVEVNNGGDWLEELLKTVRRALPVIQVRATRGKHVRAEPISALYAHGLVSHVGTFDALEDQMCKTTNAGYEGEGHGDRMDALVWGLTELFPAIVTKEDDDDDDQYDDWRDVGLGGY